MEAQRFRATPSVLYLAKRAMAAELKAGDGATADQAVVDVVEVPASAEAPETAPANVAAAPQGTAAQEVPSAQSEMVKCRRCCQEVAIEDAMCTPKFRPMQAVSCGMFATAEAWGGHQRSIERKCCSDILR